MKVFISSTQKDWDLAKDLARRLHNIGLQVLAEEETERPGKGGSTINRGLRHLRMSDEVILLLTEEASANEKIIFEIGAALSLQKKITPIIVGVDKEKLPPLLKNLNYIKYAEVEDYLSKRKKEMETTAD
ncbi:MAG: toll/interleukin-1 receptor domain-containing protein [candidate division KSB1 bacterium]|nr:toll/interleukin-1 receptor domain-containing protein [candidate division KSB1 bacterium]